MRKFFTRTAASRSALLTALLTLSMLLGFSAPASAAFVEYVGANNVVGSDGVSRYVQVWMIFDDQFKKLPGTPPPVPGGFKQGTFGHFDIISYTVHVSGLGVFASTNGRLNIWYKRTPADFTYYTEELEVLEDHGQLRFFDGGGNPWSWSPWLASPAHFALPPEMMIPVLNIAPGYSYSHGNEIHLFPVCRCKGRPCLEVKNLELKH